MKDLEMPRIDPVMCFPPDLVSVVNIFIVKWQGSRTVELQRAQAVNFNPVCLSCALGEISFLQLFDKYCRVTFLHAIEEIPPFYNPTLMFIYFIR